MLCGGFVDSISLFTFKWDPTLFHLDALLENPSRLSHTGVQSMTPREQKAAAQWPGDVSVGMKGS